MPLSFSNELKCTAKMTVDYSIEREVGDDDDESFSTLCTVQ